jgi:hypothetical protein
LDRILLDSLRKLLPITALHKFIVSDKFTEADNQE